MERVKFKGKSAFELGTVFQSWGASNIEKHGAPIQKYLRRHARKDWGDISEHDKQYNDLAVNSGWLIHSSYTLDGYGPFGNNAVLYILTYCDREETIIMLSHEYQGDFT